MARKVLAAMKASADEESAAPLSSLNEPMAPDSETIQQKVAEVAYYKAEKRGFVPGFEMEDWLEAEREVKGGLFSVRQMV